VITSAPAAPAASVSAPLPTASSGVVDNSAASSAISQTATVASDPLAGVKALLPYLPLVSLFLK